jgi:hypothetical protein
VIVLASHLPGEGHFRSERFEVVGVECRDDLDYWRGMAACWDHDETIVNLEHDLEITDGHVQALLDCPHPLCSWAYACHWATTHLSHDVYAAGTGARDAARQPEPDYVRGGEEWAAWSAIGLIKLTPRARTAPLRQEPWSALELAVHDAVSRPWHMHWPPITHHHW